MSVLTSTRSAPANTPDFIAERSRELHVVHPRFAEQPSNFMVAGQQTVLFSRQIFVKPLPSRLAAGQVMARTPAIDDNGHSPLPQGWMETLLPPALILSFY